MYVQILRKNPGNYLSGPYEKVKLYDGSNEDRVQAIPENIIPSLAFLLVVLSVLVICLSFVKKTIRFFRWEKKPKKTVQCTRISVISESESVLSIDKMMRFVPLNQFKEHYKELVSDSCYKLSLEFESLKARGDNLPLCEQGERGINRPKNRFVNVLPFDHSRYVLAPLNEICGSDYINANFISGYHSDREYIATQGPLKNTVNDFWRMCWESETKCIVMLTRCVDKDREKCFRYWPSGRNPEVYENIEVEVMEESLESDKWAHKWITTDFILRCEGHQRHIRHYQFLSWPDFSSVEPPNALIHFVQKVRQYSPHPINGNNSHPIVIHCSAGVGRTGTFIGVDVVINQIRDKGAISIPQIVMQMRNERVWMVQTEAQYHCMYKCAIAFLDDIVSANVGGSSNVILGCKSLPESSESGNDTE